MDTLFSSEGLADIAETFGVGTTREDIEKFLKGNN